MGTITWSSDWNVSLKQGLKKSMNIVFVLYNSINY